MKKYIYLIFFFLIISAGAIAQESVAGGNDQGPKKPIIDDITAVTILPERESFNFEDGDINSLDNSDINILNNTSGTSNSTNAMRGNNSETLKPEKEIFEEVKQNLKLYPNPAVNYLNVDLGQTAIATINLVNIVGQEVYQKEGEFRNIQINVDDFPKGSYFLSIQIGSELIVKRVEIAK